MVIFGLMVIIWSSGFYLIGYLNIHCTKLVNLPQCGGRGAKGYSVSSASQVKISPEFWQQDRYWGIFTTR